MADERRFRAGDPERRHDLAGFRHRGTSLRPDMTRLVAGEQELAKYRSTPRCRFKEDYGASLDPDEPGLSLAGGSPAFSAAAAFGPPLAMPTSAGRNTRSPIM